MVNLGISKLQSQEVGLTISILQQKRGMCFLLAGSIGGGGGGALLGGQERKVAQHTLGRGSASLAQPFMGSRGFIVRGKVHGGARKGAPRHECWGEVGLAFSTHTSIASFNSNLSPARK